MKSLGINGVTLCVFSYNYYACTCCVRLDYVEMVCSFTIVGFGIWQKMERASQDKQNGTNFSSVFISTFQWGVIG